MAYLIDSLPMKLVRCWTRLRLPRAQQLLQRAGVWDQSRWHGEPLRTCRGRWHGFRLRLDAADFHQRGALFHGRLLDIDVQLCMRALLRRGDTCIDVGANIGMLSMLAAHCVGPRGRVIAFEPNPDIFERLSWHLAENSLRQVQAHRLALSDREASMPLTVPPTGNTGAATLGRLPPRHGGRVGATYDVPLRPGDDALGTLPEAPMLLKLDVEGHETAAIRGLERTIRAHRPAILIEVNVEMLPASGTSVNELFEVLGDLGYSPMAFSVAWSRWTRQWRLRLHPVPDTWRPVRTLNALFLPQGGIHRDRLAHLELRAPKT